MGVFLNKIEYGEIQPCCSDCGIPLCWSIDVEEYISYKPFWDNWICEYCNPEYRGKYNQYQIDNKPMAWINEDNIHELTELYKLSHE